MISSSIVPLTCEKYHWSSLLGKLGPLVPVIMGYWVTVAVQQGVRGPVYELKHFERGRLWTGSTKGEEKRTKKMSVSKG